MPAVDPEIPLRQTGPGTPLGQLLRCYWLPFALVTELTAERPVQPVRMLSEDLVLFRATDGRPGLIQARCPHGGYPLAQGSVEETGIVCARHGWHFDLQGNCFVVNFTGTIYPMAWAHARTYPVEEAAGLYWAYLGVVPAPPLPKLLLSIASLRLEPQPVLELPWLAVREALPPEPDSDGLRLLLPVDDTHTWQVALAADSATVQLESSSALQQEALLQAIARIDAGEEPAAVARTVAHPLIVAGRVAQENHRTRSLKGF